MSPAVEVEDAVFLGSLTLLVVAVRVVRRLRKAKQMVVFEHEPEPRAGS